MRIFLAGGTGAIGRQLVPLLVRAGHEVIGITRSPARAGQLRAQGAVAVIGDVFERERLQKLLRELQPETVINQLTSIPQKMHPRRIEADMQATNRLRTEGTRLLVESAKAAGTQRFVTQSIAFAYRPGSATPATEQSPLYRDAAPGFARMVDAVCQSEDITLGTPGIDGTVLRYGFFYGPGTIYARDGGFAEEVRRRRVPLVGGAAGVFSFIHVADAAAATLAALDERSADVYNIVDDEPARVRDWLPYYAKVLAAEPPFRVPWLLGRLAGGSYLTYLMTEQRGASSSLAQTELDWKPQYKTWRDGFRSELAAS